MAMNYRYLKSKQQLTFLNNMFVDKLKYLTRANKQQQTTTVFFRKIGRRHRWKALNRVNKS